MSLQKNKDHTPSSYEPKKQNENQESNPNKTTTNTADAGKNKVRGFLTKLGLPAAVVVALVTLYSFFFTDDSNAITDFIDTIEQTQADDRTQDKNDDKTIDIEDVKDNKGGGKQDKDRPTIITQIDNYLPTSTTKSVVAHDYFTLSYAEKYEQPEWVAYELSKSNLQGEKHDRHNRFKSDPLVKTGSAKPGDYTRSGYDRGHLAAAADMAFSSDAMKQSFFMSNISPQEPSFNRGIWRELEEQTRDWCKDNEHFYVVVGPILTQRAKKRIGEDKGLAVPRSYYKVLLDLKSKDQKAVGFIMENKKSDQPLTNYMVPVDSIETLTGIDFFPELPDDLENKLESKYSEFRWPYNYARFYMRVNQWNKEAEKSVTTE